MTIIEGFFILLLFIMVGCSIEEMTGAYRERTEAILKIAGIVEIEEPSKLWIYIKKKIMGIVNLF